MELPRRILIGYGVLGELSGFLSDLGAGFPYLVVTGPHVAETLKQRVEELLKEGGSINSWCVVEAATLQTQEQVEKEARSSEARTLIGLGGGKAVDIAKLAAHRLGRDYVSIPTSASHDGIASPFASIKGLNRPYSVKAKPPTGILADIDLVSKAPRRLLASGCADLMAKETAVKDWELARDEVGEYYGKYAASLALMSARIVAEEARGIGRGVKESIRALVEALISSGVAMGIAGSSRPGSGSEHLFSHALDILAPGSGLHGEKCGLGAVMMAQLHSLDWTRFVKALEEVGAPTRAAELKLTPDVVVKALVKAPTIRPERYTILHKLRLDEERALSLARSVGVL